MENIDLDINNYDFEELKKLFNIENEFNNTGLKISLIVDLKGKFIGTITDGDIRRSLLKKFTLKDKISSIINYKPVYVSSNSHKNIALIVRLRF